MFAPRAEPTPMSMTYLVLHQSLYHSRVLLDQNLVATLCRLWSLWKPRCIAPTTVTRPPHPNPRTIIRYTVLYTAYTYPYLLPSLPLRLFGWRFTRRSSGGRFLGPPDGGHPSSHSVPYHVRPLPHDHVAANT